MVIDKIKKIIGDEIFNYWSSVRDLKVAEKAYYELKEELDNGLIPIDLEYKYRIELKYLKYLSNI